MQASRGAFVSLLLSFALTTTFAAKDNWGVTKFDVRRVTWNWNIENYSRHGLSYGQDMRSPIFKGNDSSEYEWQLQLFPRGHTPKSRAWVSLYLDLVTKQAVSAEVQLAIIHKNGRPYNIKSFVKKYPGENWGFPLFIGHVALEKGLKLVYLPNDVLTISADISFNIGLIQASKQCRNIKVDKCTSLPYTSVFMNDLQLLVEQERTKVHKAALIAHSEWIKEQLTTHPTAYVLSLPKDVKLDVFKQALAFVYSGKINANEEMLKKLLVLSNKLGMNKLKLYVEQALCKAMTSSSAKEILELAKNNKARNLKREAQNYLVAVESGIVKY